MVADNKKAQTVRNLWYTRVAKQIEDANAVVAAIRQAITDNALAGEFTAGELTAMQTVETDLIALAALSGVTQAAAAVVSGHENNAVVIMGVNDG